MQRSLLRGPHPWEWAGWLAGLLLLTLAGPARAQAALGVEPLDQLLAALNQGSVAPLQPYLTPNTRVGRLPATYTEVALAQLVPQFGPVTAARVLRHQAAGANERYVCAFTHRGTEQECSFVLTPAGQFAELNLGPPNVPALDAQLDAQDLTTPDRVELPAQLVNGLLVVQAEVDGRTGAFFFDSGAPELLLNQREFAPVTGARPRSAQIIRGVNGDMAGAARYPLRRFNCQGIVLTNREVPTLDLSSLEKRLGVGQLLGIVGYSLLRPYAVTLDYRTGRVLLQKPGAAGGAPAAGVRVPFQLRGHLPVVAASVEGRPYQLGLDCGAQTNLLDPLAAVALARRLRHRERIVLRGADAAGNVATTARIPRLTLAGGRLTFRRQATTFADLGSLQRVPGSLLLEGLLGYPALSQYRTTIDYVNQEVRFEKW